MPDSVLRRSLPNASLLLASFLLAGSFAEAQNRRMLPAHLAAPANATAIAVVPSSQDIKFGLTLPLRNEAALQVLLKAQKDPNSSQYRRFLSRQEFVDKFAPTEADYDRVITFAKAQGFTISRTFENRLLVNVSGTPGQINKAFATRLKIYNNDLEQHTYYAPDAEPSVDSAVPILSVVGLSTQNRPHPMLKKASLVHANTTGSGTDGQFLGSDIRAAYAPGVALKGEGQTVGLVELGPYNLSDVQAYFKAVNQPLKVPIYNVLLDVDGVCSGAAASGGCDDGEEVIDMQQAISMAPGLSGLIIYEAYGSGSDALTAFTQAATDDVAKQLSLSFGFGGTPASDPGYEQIFMELAAQGQNLFIASGDSGANVGGVGYPGNSPNVTDVGGTDLTTDGPGGAWQSETAWIGSGGGWSTQSPIPAYQRPAINSSNQGSTSFRNIPDVAMEANTDNFYCANGTCQGGIGGTSLAAPRWAGFLALANEQADGSPIGFLNPTFYTLGEGPTYNSIFHDITAGNNFNTGSPNLFTAVPGYDLTTGWGSPNGQSMLNTLAPAGLSTSPNFLLTVSPATDNLIPGGSATGTVTVSPANGFDGKVDLSVSVIGAPAGVTAELGVSSISGSGSTTLSIQTTAVTPGGSFAVAITGTSAGVMHTAYVQLALPDFSLSATPTSIYLNQQDRASTSISVEAINGFNSPVSLALSGLPPEVRATFTPAITTSTSNLVLTDTPLAPTTSGVSLNLSGTSGGTTRTIPSLAVAVSAALGDCGFGDEVDLGRNFNLVAIHKNGSKFRDAGLDGDGYALSGELLTQSRVLNGVRFSIGAPDVRNAIYGAGQTIALPHGRYNALHLLGTAIQGNQSNQPLTVTYEDGSSQHLTLSFSDWFSPSINVDEAEAVAMPYRVTASGSTDARQFNVYGYTILLEAGKTVQSMTLPSNRNIILLSATLTDANLGQQVNLAADYNATGVYTDGSSFPADGGIDGGGAAYSANLLNLPFRGYDIALQNTSFHLSGGNAPNTVYGAGQTLELPEGLYADLKLLGTGVQGTQVDQPITIHYLDGSSMTVKQSFSDWSSPSGFTNESVAIKTAYRDYSDGSENAQAFYVYVYDIKLDPSKRVSSITLPNNRYVTLLSMSFDRPSSIEKDVAYCLFGKQ